jgi:hypothetical protein
MSESSTPPPAHERSSSRTVAFIEIVVLEAAIIVALWLLGRLFS